MSINIEDLSNLRKYKIGTIDWLNNLQRLAQKKVGRELSAKEVKNLYQMELANSARANYTPNFKLSSQYSGKPGNIKTGEGKLIYKGQANPRKVEQPKLLTDKIISNNTGFTMQGEGKMSGVGAIPRPQPVQPRVSGALTNDILPRELVGPNPQIAGGYGSMVSPTNTNQVYPRVQQGVGSQGTPLTRFDGRAIYTPKVKPSSVATTATASKGVGGLWDILKSPAGKSGKIAGATSGIFGIPYLTTVFDDSRTTKDKILDTATGASYLAGLASLFPQGRVASTAMNVIGRLGPVAGIGLGLIPRDNTSSRKQIGQLPTDETDTKPIPQQQVNNGNEMVNRVANASNINLDTNIPLTNSTPVNGQASGLISGAPKYVGDMQNKINQIAKAKNTDPKIVEGIINKIITEANRQGVDPAIALAMAQMESGFDSNATSPAGAGGIFQLMPGTAQGLGVKNVYDPDQNIRGGITYLRQQMRANPGNLNNALASYNAGPGAVAKYGGVPPYKETQNYINNIAHHIPIWRSALNGSQSGQVVPVNNNVGNVSAVIPGGGDSSYKIEQPSTTGAWDMLYKMWQEQQKNQGDTSVNIGLGYGGTYDPYEYMTPNELRSLENLQGLNSALDPDTISQLIDDYYREQRRVNDWNLIHSPSDTKMEVTGTGLDKLKALYDFVSTQNKNEMELYNSLMKRADAMRMAKRYGIPYSALAENMNGVLQYVINPEITQRYKNENRIPDAMMEIIKTQAQGEQTRANDINKANALINTTNNEWANWKYPLGINEILSKIRMNNADNLAKGVGYYTQAEIAKYKVDAQERLVQIGIPPKMASSLSMALPYMTTQAKEQAIQYIMNMTGISAGEATDIVNSVPADNSASIVNTLIGSGTSGGWDIGD